LNLETAKELMNDIEAAEYLGGEPRTLRLWQASRGLPYFRIIAMVVR
jgi:hypothetical protein